MTEQDSELYDREVIYPLLIALLESFTPELHRHGYFTAPVVAFDWYMMDLPVARDPMTAKTTTSSVHLSYVIDCNRPAIMVSLHPYRLYDTGFSEEWQRDTMPEFVEMLRTADRSPLVAKILKGLQEDGRLGPISPKHWSPKKVPGAHP